MTRTSENTGLKPYVEAMKKAKILVAGDIMLDRFVYGGVDRISPESPVPVLSIKREDKMLGGAGNALANIAGLGAKGFILSVIGEDEDGAAIHDLIKKHGFTTEGLIGDAARPTTVKTRFLAGHQQLLRTDFEVKAPVSKTISDALLKKADALMGDMDALLISDYGKGLLTPAFIASLIKLAKKHKLPVIVDPKGNDFSIYKGATAITPNKKELSEATGGMAVNTDAAVIAAAQKLIKTCGIDSVIATRSAEGMSVIDKKAATIHFPAAAIEVFDVSGAGDTVIATVAAGLAAGASLAQAAELANIAGGIVVAKVGTAAIRASELIETIERTGNATICNWEQAQEQIKRWKAKGLKTGFTNGCFDILHYGHVSYLTQARKNCDRLIVGLNLDSSVKILKGADRPVHDENSRAAVLAALSSVDMVVFFGAKKASDDNTAKEILSLLKPDLYFKGGDYTEKQIPEAPTVRAYGGDVRIMPVYEGHSTTSSLAKSKSKAA